MTSTSRAVRGSRRRSCRLGLVDQYHFVVHPVVSAGRSWFDGIEEKRELNLLSAAAYSNGVVGLNYEPKDS